MRFSPDETIAGRPAPQVTDVAAPGPSGVLDDQGSGTRTEDLRRPGAPLVYALRALGYVEVAPQQRPGTWRNTKTGNTPANATAAGPISRADALQRLEEFLERVSLVNADDSLPHRVGKVVVFGSDLSNQNSIGDIDVAIRLDRQLQFGDRWAEALSVRSASAEAPGRRFRGLFDRLAWAEDEIKRRLRGRVRSLSLHGWNTEEP